MQKKNKSITGVEAIRLLKASYYGYMKKIKEKELEFAQPNLQFTQEDVLKNKLVQYELERLYLNRAEVKSLLKKLGEDIIE